MKKVKSLLSKNIIFAKYVISAGISFVLDLSLFTIFVMILKNYMGDIYIVVATISARIISSLCNYLMNRNAVFKVDNNKGDVKSLTGYYTLVVINMLVSSLLVLTIFKLTRLNEILIKIPVDVIIFVMNYFVQKKIIFVKK